MQKQLGQIKEIIVDAKGYHSIWLTCPPGTIPSTGQYLYAWAPSDPDETLGVPLFLARADRGGFLSAADVPHHWQPGFQLEFRGPLGRGFSLQRVVGNLLLVALGDVIDRLIPLVDLALENDLAVALFTDCHLPNIPSAVEVAPVKDLPGAIDWARFFYIDLPLTMLPSLREILGLKPGDRLPCPAEALIFAPFACAGMADCGVCAVPVGRRWKLACVDGPVFSLDQLDW